MGQYNRALSVDAKNTVYRVQCSLFKILKTGGYKADTYFQFP